MTKEKFEEIFENTEGEWKGDNAFQGLQIIAKYFDPKKETIICWGAHDTLGSVSIDDLIEKGVTEEDVKNLAILNWTLEDDCLMCYV